MCKRKEGCEEYGDKESWLKSGLKQNCTNLQSTAFSVGQCVFSLAACFCHSETYELRETEDGLTPQFCMSPTVVGSPTLGAECSLITILTREISVYLLCLTYIVLEGLGEQLSVSILCVTYPLQYDYEAISYPHKYGQESKKTSHGVPLRD